MAHSQKPDLILMDIMMPKLDGIGACYVLKSDVSTRAIPIIMASVRTDKLDQDYSKDMGADDYLTKPFNLRALLNVISQLLPSQ
jgi:two-component system cell cycle response regulator